MTSKATRPPRSIDGKYRVQKTMTVDPAVWEVFTKIYVPRQQKLNPNLSQGNCFEALFQQANPEYNELIKKLQREKHNAKKKLIGSKPGA